MRRVAIWAAALAIAGVGCTRMTADWHLEPGVDFARYKTFSFAPRESAPGSVMANRDIAESEIRKQLAAKGFEYRDEGAQLVVSFNLMGHAVVYDSLQRNRSRGTLSINFVDASSGRLLWHGYAEETIYDPTTAPKKIPEAVELILAPFPSRSS